AFSSAGTFFWQAAYSGDANNGAATSACTSEQLTVGKASPTIATTLSSSSITVGGSGHDSATLTGATTTAGGTVTYTVYTNNPCTPALGPHPTPQPDTSTIALHDALPISAFSSAGTFFWQAAYSGDANNNAASSACTSEQLTVGKASPTIATTL